MHQYALVGRGHSIHSPGHWEWNGSEVNDRSKKVQGGKQCILCPTSTGFDQSLCNSLDFSISFSVKSVLAKTRTPTVSHSMVTLHSPESAGP